jgi:hypothetical protein
MERKLPTGRAVNELEVVASEPPRTFAIRTTSGPTPFLYRHQLSEENGETIMKLDARSSCPGPPPSCRSSLDVWSRRASMTTSRR